MNPGTIDWIRQRAASEFLNFERFENREDSSDIDDLLMKSIASIQIVF